MEEVVLHPGDNGQQVFYEAQDHSWLVFRNHAGSTWMVQRHGSLLMDLSRTALPGHHFVLGAQSLEDMLRKVREQYDVTLRIDESWRFVETDGASMALRFEVRA